MDGDDLNMAGEHDILEVQMGNRHIEISLEKAKTLLNEGDVAIFRGKGLISWFIKSFGGSPYSHTATVSKHGDNGGTIFELVEFRELVGSRTTLLDQQVKQYSGQIDIYRANKYFYNSYYSHIKNSVVEYKEHFNGKKVTNCMRLLTGQDYDYYTIWQIAKSKLFGLRLFVNYDAASDDSITPDKYVCSTAVAHCFNSNGYDLVKRKGDKWVEPGDLARSTSLNYLFTLTT